MAKGAERESQQILFLPAFWLSGCPAFRFFAPLPSSPLAILPFYFRHDFPLRNGAVQIHEIDFQIIGPVRGKS